MYDPFHLQIKKHTQRDETDKNIDAGTNSISQESYSKMTFPTLLEKKKKAALRNTLPQMAKKLKIAFIVMAGPDKALSLARKPVFNDTFLHLLSSKNGR